MDPRIDFDISTLVVYLYPLESVRSEEIKLAFSFEPQREHDAVGEDIEAEVASYRLHDGR